MILPIFIIKKVKKVTYQFIWGCMKKDIPCAKIVLPRSEDDLMVRDLSIIIRAVSIKKAAKFWCPVTSILAEWMKSRYIRNQPIEQIQIRPTVDYGNN